MGVRTDEKYKCDTFSYGTVCILHISGSNAHSSFQESTLFHLRKYCISHFCGASRDPGIARTPLLCLLILQFRDFQESGKSILACFSFRVPTGTRDAETETREDRLYTFLEITEMQYEQGISSPFAISTSRRAAQKCKKTHFLGPEK